MGINWEAVLALVSLVGIVVSVWAVAHSRGYQQADKLEERISEGESRLDRIAGWLEGKFGVKF